ncbi:MAG: hypothetical protein OIN87_10515 [Candidatus Methanoperedens sp.]|nr:hypothetical protein [Candidatus Methanoperedens sp.]
MVYWHLVSRMPKINEEENMKKQIDREAMKAEQERIKESNHQFMISILNNEGVDANEVSRFDLDRLLRIQREVGVNERRLKELVYEFNTILNPYRPVVIANAPTTTDTSEAEQQETTDSETTEP